jgi:hypothetical protein
VNSRVPKTQKPEVSSSEIPTGVSDSCAVGPGEERLEVQKFGVEEASECENLHGPKAQNPKVSMRVLRTETLKPEVPKICRAKQGSKNLVNLKHFLIHVG